MKLAEFEFNETPLERFPFLKLGKIMLAISRSLLLANSNKMGYHCIFGNFFGEKV